MDRRTWLRERRRVAEERFDTLHAGLSVVRGEHVSRGGGYNYYPPLDQVAAWVRDARQQSLEDGYGDDYYHLLTRAAPDELVEGAS